MLRKALCGLALAALAAPASAQTVDELIAQLCEARGGLDKLRAVSSVRMLGHMAMGPNLEAPVTIERKRPRSARMELTFQGATSVQASDGRRAWGILPMGSGRPEPLPPEMARDLDNQADIDGPLVDYKAKGHQVELVGKEKLAGAPGSTEVFRLKVTLRGGDVLYSLVDAATHLELGEETKRNVRGNEVEIASRFGAYKAAGGVLWAHRIEAGPKNRSEKQALVIDQIEVNPPLGDERFRLPAGAAEEKARPD